MMMGFLRAFSGTFAVVYLLFIIMLFNESEHNSICPWKPDTRLGWVTWTVSWPGRTVACWLTEPLGE